MSLFVGQRDGKTVFNELLDTVAFRPAAVGAGGALFVAQAGAAQGAVADVNVLMMDILYISRL
jgi:hypothetical protein